MDLYRALFDRLSGDAGLIALLAPYGAGRALFSGVAPEDFDIRGGLCVVIGPVVSQGDRDSFDRGVRDAEIDIRVYGPAQASTAALDAAADSVRARLHRAELTFASGEIGRARVSGPVTAATSEPDVYGRRLSVRVLAPEV